MDLTLVIIILPFIMHQVRRLCR